MPLFTLTCLDKAGSLELRMAERPRHLAFLENFKDSVKLAGPLLHDTDNSPIGSHLILDMASLAEVQAFAAADPYAVAGLFETSTIHTFRATIGTL
jgi:uncharacterized protein